MSDLDEAEKKLASNDAEGAYLALRPVLGYPASGLEERALFARAAAVLAELSRRFGAAPLAETITKIAREPDDARALYDAGYGLYEQGQFDFAAAMLARANRIAPGQSAIVSELATALERLTRSGEAALFLDASGTPERDPFCAYLSGFHWIMSGDLDVPRKRVAQLASHGDERVAFMRGALEGMLARADALRAAGITLDDRALTAWHAVLSGSLLLHESPHGHDHPMRGRYAFVQDTPALMREGIERLAGVLGRTSRVIAAPDRPSRILARAAATRMGVPCIDWTPGVERGEGLVVAWSLEAIEDTTFLRALHTHAPGQRLFAHASCWTEPLAYAPDVTTILHQSITHPWTGGAMVVDPATQQITRAAPDPRSDDALAAEILATTQEDESVTSRDHVLAIARALASLPEAHRLGLHRASGQRFHQRLGGPVPSARFL
ncbi:hypothetical protein [Sandaracinus amylolyticus]|uniref:Uncharacterized protein n=1 Tax=Sandaracinus amylolyticus TaxID=927083 RepID=A0A0F6W761_9BACT|nr:hypothetical protein [Sandaracinus amylolyticus]AKF09200.1 hypothetical protein DB32_006349 [Sandaracinus amylolyticus]